jgi:hypothetical protein
MREVSGDIFIVQQDNAPAHRAHETVRLLEHATPAFIPPDLWPPNSPGLTPVDYKIWGALQLCMYQTKLHDINELKQRLVDIWHGTEQCY